MPQRPPPFAALRALEAACRHRSYTAAAAELNVTHSAVSQAVRRLEEEVGAKLFYRRGAHMEPAAASLTLARAYAEASQSIARAMRHLSETTPNGLTLRAPAQVARLWLAPLLSDLAVRFPNLNLSLRTEGAGDPEVDLSIQATLPAPGMDSLVLAETTLSAYASPGLLRLYKLDEPEGLLGAPLLIEQDVSAWTAWFAAAGMEMDASPRGLRFDDNTGLGVEGAVRGLGVALSDPLSVAGLIERAELNPVCPAIFAVGPTYWAAWRGDQAKARMIEPLVAWLRGEFALRMAATSARASADQDRLRA